MKSNHSNQSPNDHSHPGLESLVVIMLTGAIEFKLLILTQPIIDPILIEEGWIRWLSYHVLVLIGISIWLASLWYRQRDVRIAAVLLLCTGTLGPLGALGSFILWGIYTASYRNAARFDEWYLAMFQDNPSEYTMSEPKINQRQLTDSMKNTPQTRNQPDLANTIASFSDMLRFGTFADKQEVISRLTRAYTPEFAPVFKAALVNKDAAVRVQAATAMAHIEKTFTDKWLQLKQHAKENAHSLQAHLDIAEHLTHYVDSGLLEPDQETDILKYAQAAFLKCNTIDPAHTKTQLALIWIHIRKNQMTQAVRMLKKIPRKARSAQEMYVYCECLYHLGQFDTLRHEFKEWQYWHCYGDKISHRFEDVMNLWGPSATKQRHR